MTTQDIPAWTPFAVTMVGAICAFLGSRYAKWTDERNTHERSVDDIIRDVGHYVVPHFTPPAPGERDNTLVARVERQDLALTHHLGDELAAAAVQNGINSDVAIALAQIAGQMAEGTKRMAGIEEIVADALGKLEACNPEFRP